MNDMSKISTLRATPVRGATRAKSTVKPKWLVRKIRRQNATAVFIGVVALVILGMSLKHQAAGVMAMLHAGAADGWSMAVAIDAGFVGLELSLVFASTPAIRKEIATYARPAIVGTLAASAAMNAFAFSQDVTGLALIPAIAFGIAIPAMLYALTRIGAAMYISGTR